ncbi:MAG: MotA/TolQ/ExbB proton channel family protein [Rhodopirellula sp.]|nr:MotA/TolQ/ExbB proton channel family protein [Rhodopirellula sp.]
MIHGRYQGAAGRHAASLWSIIRALATPLLTLLVLATVVGPAFADGKGPATSASADTGFFDLVRTGGLIGGLIFALSLSMVYLMVEHLLSIRRGTLIPGELAEAVHQYLSERKIEDAKQQCSLQPCFLSNVLASGLAVIELGYRDVEKSMEDTATEQAARMFRKIEYLHLIGTLAPMLGLLGTVWGMITAFMEFEAKANPAVSELAPGIYRALVTTMLGLTVAVPAFAAFAIFRNRIDELVAEASLTAEYVFADYRRDQARRDRGRTKQERVDELPPKIPSVTRERGAQT